MSHFSQIKTQIRQLEPLQQALTELGLDWKSGTTLRGYQGATDRVEVVIPQENGYDIGFQWNGKEYALVADMQFWQQPWSLESFMQKVNQSYALQVVRNESSKQGFAVAEQNTLENGAVRLVLQRWHG